MGLEVRQKRIAREVGKGGRGGELGRCVNKLTGIYSPPYSYYLKRRCISTT